MKQSRSSIFLIAPLALATGLGLLWGAAARANDTEGKDPKPAATAAKPAEAAAKAQAEDVERLEGEKRFHNNCGRCHMAPQKFPPRMMATVVRHMRVRATITQEDMRLILDYMTQ
jgi:mono/diheme cytochrome c family protein